MMSNSVFHDQMKIIRSHQKEWPIKVVPLARDLGLPVKYVNGWDNDLSGMIRLEEDSTYCIYVNNKHPSHRRRFTIAHEIAHYVLHRDKIGDGIVDDALLRSRLSNQVEVEANRLAANILMPWDLIDKAMGQGIRTMDELADAFDVSKSAMSIRLGVPYEMA